MSIFYFRKPVFLTSIWAIYVSLEMTRPNLSFDQKSSNMSLSLCLFVSIWGTLSVSIPFPSWEMTIVMELEPQYPLIWLWSRKVERRWVVIWSWLDGKVLRHFLFSIIDPYIAIPLSRSFFFSFFVQLLPFSMIILLSQCLYCWFC